MFVTSTLVNAPVPALPPDGLYVIPTPVKGPVVAMWTDSFGSKPAATVSTYCFVAAARLVVGSPESISVPVITSPDLRTYPAFVIPSSTYFLLGISLLLVTKVSYPAVATLINPDELKVRTSVAATAKDNVPALLYIPIFWVLENENVGALADWLEPKNWLLACMSPVTSSQTFPVGIALLIPTLPVK